MSYLLSTSSIYTTTLHTRRMSVTRYTCTLLRRRHVANLAVELGNKSQNAADFESFALDIKKRYVRPLGKIEQNAQNGSRKATSANDGFEKKKIRARLLPTMGTSGAMNAGYTGRRGRERGCTTKVFSTGEDMATCSAKAATATCLVVLCHVPSPAVPANIRCDF